MEQRSLQAVTCVATRERRARTGALCAVAALLIFVTLCVAPALSQNVPETQAATQQGDPAIAAAGDIACDPLDPAFNSGSGGSWSCHQQATANLLVNLA